MNKEELLNELRRQLAAGTITDGDLRAVTGKTSAVSAEGVKRPFPIAKILYYLGGGVVVIGVAIFITQQWHLFNDFMRIFVTLGIGIAVYVMGVLFSRYERLKGAANAFYFIAGALLPTGLMVAFNIGGWDVARAGTQSIISGALLMMFVASWFLFRQRIFTLFTVIFGTWFFFSFTNVLFIGPSTYGMETRRFYEYRVLFAGIAYLFLGYAAAMRRNPLSSFLYTMGTLGVLGAAYEMMGTFFFSGGGAGDLHARLWEILFPGLVIGLIFLSTFLKSRSMLFLSSIGLVAYLFHITARYFAQSLGWPFSLVLAGFALIGIGYLAVYLNRKYLKQ